MYMCPPLLERQPRQLDKYDREPITRGDQKRSVHAKETENEKRERIRGEERREDHIDQPTNYYYHYHHQVQRQRSVAFSRLRATHSKSTTTTTPPPDRSPLSNRKLETCFRPFPLPARRGRTTKQGRNGGYPVLPGLPTSSLSPPPKRPVLGTAAPALKSSRLNYSTRRILASFLDGCHTAFYGAQRAFYISWSGERECGKPGEGVCPLPSLHQKKINQRAIYTDRHKILFHVHFNRPSYLPT